MGYYTYFEGEINIEPPLDADEARKSGWLETGRYDTNPYPIMIASELDRIIPCMDDHMKAYDIVDEMKEIVEMFPNHKFNGMYECTGEEAGDLWRLRVRDSVVSVVKPEIVWPED
jgi:hypothetical protein